MNKKIKIGEVESLADGVESNELILQEQVIESDDFIKIADGVDIKKLVEGDDDPLFVIREIVHEGVSRNGNDYTREDILELERQLLAKKPNAYKGHIRPENFSSANPDAKTIWIGAGVKEINGKLSLWGKGYVLPYAKNLKISLRKALAAGKSLPVSIYYKAKRAFDKATNTFKLSGINLLSIDWAREFAEGVPSNQPMFLSSEMEGDMDYSKLTLELLKENRPDLVEEMQKSDDSSVLSEMASSLNVAEDQVLATVQEMASSIQEKELVISEMKKEQNVNLVKSKLSEKVSSKAIRKVVETLVLAEMDSASIDSPEKADEFLAEMLKRDEVVELLKAKEDHSVPPVIRENNTPSKSVVKVVKKQR